MLQAFLTHVEQTGSIYGTSLRLQLPIKQETIFVT